MNRWRDWRLRASCPLLVSRWRRPLPRKCCRCSGAVPTSGMGTRPRARWTRRWCGMSMTWPELLAVGKDIFARLVMGDQAEFRNQNPEFDADPVAVLKRTLIVARSHAELRQRYVDTLLPLVYETQPPTFEQAFAAFETVAQDYLS